MPPTTLEAHRHPRQLPSAQQRPKAAPHGSSLTLSRGELVNVELTPSGCCLPEGVGSLPVAPGIRTGHDRDKSYSVRRQSTSGGTATTYAELRRFRVSGLQVMPMGRQGLTAAARFIERKPLPWSSTRVVPLRPLSRRPRRPGPRQRPASAGVERLRDRHHWRMTLLGALTHQTADGLRPRRRAAPAGCGRAGPIRREPAARTADIPVAVAAAAVPRSPVATVTPIPPVVP